MVPRLATEPGQSWQVRQAYWDAVCDKKYKMLLAARTQHAGEEPKTGIAEFVSQNDDQQDDDVLL